MSGRGGSAATGIRPLLEFSMMGIVFCRSQYLGLWLMTTPLTVLTTFQDNSWRERSQERENPKPELKAAWRDGPIVRFLSYLHTNVNKYTYRDSFVSATRKTVLNRIWTLQCLRQDSKGGQWSSWREAPILWFFSYLHTNVNIYTYRDSFVSATRKTVLNRIWTLQCLRQDSKGGQWSSWREAPILWFWSCMHTNVYVYTYRDSFVIKKSFAATS